MRRRDCGVLFIWASALLVVVAVYVTRTDLRLARPAIFLPFCLWLLVPVRQSGLVRLQVAVFLYLMWLIFAAAFDVFWTLPAHGDGVRRVSITVPAVALMAMGWLARRCLGFSSVSCGPAVRGSLLLSATVISGHALFLWGLLWRVYGYGWEEDATVFGRVGLFVIVFTGMAPVAYCYATRSSLALMMAIVLFIGSMP